MPPSTMTHHHLLPPTNSQNISTTTHHHPPPAKIYPPPPTTSQNTSTTTYNFPKNGPPPRKSQNIFIYISFWHCCNSFLFLEMKYSFPSWRFCVAKFWSVHFSSSKFLLTFRSSHRRCSVRIGVLRNFAIHRKTPVLGLRPATLLKKRLWHRCFPVNFAKFLRTPFLQTTSRRLLL